MDEKKENYLLRTCSRNEGNKNYRSNFTPEKQRDHLRNLAVDGNIKMNI
jgi:hypothetical protein